MTKANILKEIGSKGDAIAVDVKGNCYIIYNPNNGNGDNAEMWSKDGVEVFCLSFKEYKTLEYKDILYISKEGEVGSLNLSSYI